MEIGMLWFDNDPQLELGEKVRKAADYFQNKYRQAPNVCFVHPSMITDVSTQAGMVAICSHSAIQPHHFWIGFAQEGHPEVQQVSDLSG